ncbi:hypothetical protein ACJX0J_009302, partial [Zea mays]
TSPARWVLTVGASDSWATGQSGGAPDSHCSLSGAPSGACPDFCTSVADALSSSSGVDRAWRLRAPLRDGAGDQPSAVKVAMADDDDVNPVTGNDDLHAAGLVPDDEDDIQADAAALLGIDLTSAPVDLSSNPTNASGGPATATDTPVGSTSTDGGTGTSSV